jgi:hypothetical protein
MLKFFMRIFVLLFSILILVSCGKEAGTGRCFSREEALINCQAQEMSKLQITLETAKLICEPYFTGQACYRL